MGTFFVRSVLSYCVQIQPCTGGRPIYPGCWCRIFGGILPVPDQLALFLRQFGDGMPLT